MRTGHKQQVPTHTQNQRHMPKESKPKLRADPYKCKKKDKCKKKGSRAKHTQEVQPAGSLVKDALKDIGGTSDHHRLLAGMAATHELPPTYTDEGLAKITTSSDDSGPPLRDAKAESTKAESDDNKTTEGAPWEGFCRSVGHLHEDGSGATVYEDVNGNFFYFDDTSTEISVVFCIYDNREMKEGTGLEFTIPYRASASTTWEDIREWARCQLERLKGVKPVGVVPIACGEYLRYNDKQMDVLREHGRVEVLPMPFVDGEWTTFHMGIHTDDEEGDEDEAE